MRRGNHLFISEPFKSTPDIQIIKYPGGLVLPPILPSTNVPHPVGVGPQPTAARRRTGWLEVVAHPDRCVVACIVDLDRLARHFNAGCYRKVVGPDPDRLVIPA